MAAARPRGAIAAGTPVGYQSLLPHRGGRCGVGGSGFRQRRVRRPGRRGPSRGRRHRRAGRRREHPGRVTGTITNAGAVTVLYGSATGLSGSGAQVFSQDSPGVLGAAEAEDGFGSALGVGDFDNDGADDLAIGVPSEGFGAISQAGAVNLLYGSGSGLTATANQQFLQGVGGVLGTAELGDEFGFALATGDYNNDTFADLAVGVPFEDIGSILDAGAVDTLNGSGGTLTTTGAQQFFQGSGGVPGTAEE